MKKCFVSEFSFLNVFGIQLPKVNTQEEMCQWKTDRRSDNIMNGKSIN